jgi:ribonuclease Z
VHASPLSHRVPTLGYVVGELARPGGLDSAKAMALGATGAALGRLKRGDDVVLDDGRTIRALDVLKAPPVRRAVCVLQDTMQSDEAEQYLTSFRCQLALLIHECTYDDSLAEQVPASCPAVKALIYAGPRVCNACGFRSLPFLRVPLQEAPNRC